MLLVFNRHRRPDASKLLETYYDSIDAAADELPEPLSDYERFSVAEEDFLSYIRNDYFSRKGAILAVWEAGVRYASAVRAEPYLDGYIIAGLETAPALRSRGYAYSLMVGVLDYLANMYVKMVYSHVHKENAISLHIHEQLGFQIASDTAVLLDGTVSSSHYTLYLKLKSAL